MHLLLVPIASHFTKTLVEVANNCFDDKMDEKALNLILLLYLMMMNLKVRFLGF